MSFPLLPVSGWWVVLYVLIATHITIASVTIYLHRSQSHMSVILHPLVSHFMRFWLWLTTGMVTKEWVSSHRKHHAFCEREGDPHSPKIYGIWHVLFGGAFLYRKAVKDRDMVEKYGRGTPDDWIERKLYSRFPALGITLLLAVNLLLFGWLAGFLAWGVQMLWIPFWAAGVINGLGHFIGYRNFQVKDNSTNLFPWGILIGGEELHNNHHRYAASPKLAVKPWEFDIGWAYIRLLELLGLAKAKRVIQ